ncbi:MAG TPA: endonuclease III [Clostridiaceae bacterium]|nr:endonuclease III [Clostridiaceae bacterium]
MRKKEKALIILKELKSLYPDATCTLDYKTPLELLIATQLAAQCTDARVNIVTKELFKKYRNAEDFAGADLSELEQDIKSTGFFRNKARNIKECCIKLLRDYGGKVPDNMEDLLSLPGVGRKTANVVLSTVFSKPGVIVDTHCMRLANRLGLTKSKNPDIVERDLMKILPESEWANFSHYLVYHGRAICQARRPKCEICSIMPYCVYANKNIQ